MPRAIGGSSVSPGGIASYKLSGNEEWTLLAATFTANMANANDDDMLVLDARDAAGGVITRQLVDYVHVTTSYSLSVEAEPFLIDSNGNTAWPQQSVAAGDYFVTERLTPVTLIPGCTLNVYASLGFPTAGTDPLASLDTGVLIQDLHLWVEDTQGVALQALNVGNPILLGVG